MPRHISSIAYRIRHLYIRREKSEQMWAVMTWRLLCIGYLLVGIRVFPAIGATPRTKAEKPTPFNAKHEKSVECKDYGASANQFCGQYYSMGCMVRAIHWSSQPWSNGESCWFREKQSRLYIRPRDPSNSTKFPSPRIIFYSSNISLLSNERFLLKHTATHSSVPYS